VRHTQGKKSVEFSPHEKVVSGSINGNVVYKQSGYRSIFYSVPLLSVINLMSRTVCNGYQ
jgi:hypothetical protein